MFKTGIAGGHTACEGQKCQLYLTDGKMWVEAQPREPGVQETWGNGWLCSKDRESPRGHGMLCRKLSGELSTEGQWEGCQGRKWAVWGVGAKGRTWATDLVEEGLLGKAAPHSQPFSLGPGKRFQSGLW